MPTYVVTGASRGLGLEFVRQVSAQGHTVIALARNPDKSENLQKLIDNKKVFAFKLDVLDKESIKVRKRNREGGGVRYTCVVYLIYWLL